MAKMTLLDMVQEILSDMNSDNVNSISDTIEAQQVANIIKRTYFNLHAERVWPHTGRLFRLSASTDSTRPTHMKMEEAVVEILWVKYDTRKLGGDPLHLTDMRYMRPEEFLDYTLSRKPEDSNITTVIDYNGTPLLIRNDAAPSYYTTFDDEHIVFDSYNSAVDSTLQHSKVQVYGYVEPEWVMSDTFVPDVPSKAFSYFMAEAKSTAFLKIKEVFSQPDAAAAAKQKAWLSREKHRLGGHTRYPDYSKPNGRYARRGKYRNNQFIG